MNCQLSIVHCQLKKYLRAVFRKDKDAFSCVVKIRERLDTPNLHVDGNDRLFCFCPRDVS